MLFYVLRCLPGNRQFPAREYSRLMGEGSTGGNESGCSSSATCEHSPGTACWHSARAKNQAEKLPAPRFTPSGMKNAGLNSCFDFLHFRRLRYKPMHLVEEDESNKRVDVDTCLERDEPQLRVAPVDLPQAFIRTTTTTTSCREGRSTSFKTSPPMLSVSLRKLASCTSPR